MAQELGLHIIKGPFWDALNYGAFPNWYAEYCQNELEPYRAWYICKDDTIAESILGINRAGGHLTVSEEARLLGAAHHPLVWSQREVACGMRSRIFLLILRGG